MSQEQFETNRKIFHSLGILCPIIYLFTPKLYAVIMTFLIAAFVVYVDIYRFKNSKIQYWVEFFLGKIIRDSEKDRTKLAGCSWMFIAIFITCLFCSKDVAIFSWLVLFVCDSLAAIIGTRYGKNKIANNKTMEGSMSFFFASIMLGVIYHTMFASSFGFISLIIASVAATFVEIYSKSFGIDDNLSIPIIVGLVLTIL